MSTPIYDELIGRARSEEPSEEPAADAEMACSCAWCGTPVSGGAVSMGDAAVEFEADDPETGDQVTLTVCSAEHRAALQSYRAAAAGRVSWRPPAGS